MIANDPRRMGFGVGQQIVGLYLTEMLLKYALDNSGVSHGHRHNLHDLFRKLSRPTPSNGGAKVHKDSEQRVVLGLGTPPRRLTRFCFTWVGTPSRTPATSGNRAATT